jgi:restriction system protein
MNWKLNDNSLFAILLRSPWWMSVALGGALGPSP